MKVYGGSECIDPRFLNLEISLRSASRSHHFAPEKRASGIHWIGVCVGPSAGTGDVVKRKFSTPLGLEHRFLRRSARSQSLYRLCYSSATNCKFSNLLKHSTLTVIKKKFTCKQRLLWARDRSAIQWRLLSSNWIALGFSWWGWAAIFDKRSVTNFKTRTSITKRN
jgi:hypothetical protein